MKKVLGIVLAAVMLLSSVPLADFSVAVFSFRANAGSLPTYAEATSKEVGPSYQTGDHIQFGTYPQSRVTNEATIAKLEKAEKTWKSYGYYSGTGIRYDGKMKPGDYMKFADFFCNGTKYRAVEFSEYRPVSTNDNTGVEHSRQDENGYTAGTTYYFSYAPLTWRVLDASTGFILCENAIDAQAFQNAVYSYGTEGDNDGIEVSECWQDADLNIPANNYATSSIRDWLNYDFYETAFTDAQKEKIKTSGLSAEKTDAASDEKVFLISFEEAITEEYGFKADTSNDSARALQGTDYAQCQGFFNGDWYLNTPGEMSGTVYSVNKDGSINEWELVYYTDFGVRPACRLTALNSDTTTSQILFSGKSGTGEEDSHEHIAGPATVENRVNATCKDPGSYDSVVRCTVCNMILSTTHVDVPIAAYNHVAALPVKEKVVNATCKETGSYEVVVYCKNCGRELSRIYKEIPRLPYHVSEYALNRTVVLHSDNSVYLKFNETEYSDLLKTDGAYADYIGTTIAAQKYLPIANNNGEARSCADGAEYCALCGIKINDSLDHKWGEGTITKQPTSDTEGEIQYQCQICSEKKTERIQNIDWTKNGNLGLACFTVVNAQTKKPLTGAEITVFLSEGTKAVTTDSDGKASVVLPVGTQTVTASYPGCISRTLKIKIEHKENDIPAIGLSNQPVVEASLTSKVMSYEEITNAGIDVDDPENYNVVKYEATFVFESKEIKTEFIISGGDSYVPNGNGGWTKGGGIYVPETDTVIYPSEKFYLVVSGEVKWLKEMFDVQMYIWNNSQTDTLENLNATLTLPEGLSLAAMEEGEQSAAQHIDKIAEGGSAVAQWFVRGDKAGKYSLSATLTGTVMPFEEDFTNTYTSDDTITVYGTGALQFTFKSPETFVCGEKYPITISLTNVSEHTLYNVAHMITGVDAFKVEQFKKGASVPVKVKHPGATFNPYAFDAVMEPGDRLDLTFSVTIDASEFFNRVFKLTDFFFESDALVTAIHENFGYSSTHSFGDWKEEPAKYPCLEGKKTRQCKTCGFIEEEVIEAVPHTPGEPEETVTKPATETEDGEKKVTVRCTVCGEIIREWTEKIPASDGHKWDEGTVSVEPSCQKAGLKIYLCEDCGEIKKVVIPKLDHDLHHVVNPATCSIEGAEYDVCTMCETIFNYAVTPRLPHPWDEGEETVKANCKNEGEKLFTCTVCGEKKTEIIPKTKHQPAEAVKENVVEATCAKTGSCESVIYCKICGTLLERICIETPKLTTHTQGEPVETIITDAACGRDGTKKITVNCSVCGITLSEQIVPIPATGEHKWDEGKETISATCEKDGEKVFTCTVCGTTRTEIIKATGEHTWDEGKETKAATCVEEGVKTFTCQVCGAEKTEPIPLAEHSYGPWKFLKVPNYHEGGQAQHTCKICGHTEIRNYDPVTPDIIKEDTGTDVTVGYMNETYDDDIELEVTNVFDGSSYNFLNKEKTNFQFEIFDISMYIKGEKVQPNGTVLVKLPIPGNYSRDKLVIYYVTNTGVVEKMDMWIDGDFACFEAEHFSCYALVDEAKEVITLGDVDGDGKITSADARLALRRSVKLEAYALGSNPYRACDVDRDGNVSSADARSILRVSVKLEDESSWK